MYAVKACHKWRIKVINIYEVVIDMSDIPTVQEVRKQLEGTGYVNNAEDMALKTLYELLKLCDNQDIDKQGLMREISEGLEHERDMCSVAVGNKKEVQDLEIGLVAKRGRKRITLEQPGKDLQVPQKLLEHELQL